MSSKSIEPVDPERQLEELRSLRLQGREFLEYFEEKIQPYRDRVIEIRREVAKAAPKMSDDRKRKLWMQQWFIEFRGRGGYARIVESIRRQAAETGEYDDVVRLIEKQAEEERRHRKQYADLLIGRGWVESEEELERRFMPSAMLTAFTTLNSHAVADYPLAVNYAAVNLGAEVISEANMEALLSYVTDEDWREVLKQQLADERKHTAWGRYVLERYANDPEVQAHCLTMARNVLEIQYAMIDFDQVRSLVREISDRG